MANNEIASTSDPYLRYLPPIGKPDRQQLNTETTALLAQEILIPLTQQNFEPQQSVDDPDELLVSQIT